MPASVDAVAGAVPSLQAIARVMLRTATYVARCAVLLAVGELSCACADTGVSAARPADVVILEGVVLDSKPQWTLDRRAIVTRSHLARLDGSTVEVVQLGGTVDGIGMWISHHPPLLEPGARVQVAAVAQRPHRYVAQRLLSSQVAPAHQRADAPGAARYGVARTNVTGKPLRWDSGCIPLAYDTAGSTHVSGSAEFQILDEAAAAWTAEGSLCTDVEFVISQAPAPADGRNGLNGVAFREDRWCQPAAPNAPEICYEPSLAATTRVFFVDDANSERDGVIVEADVEFNGVHFAFAIDGLSLGGAPVIADLRSVATHELGHLLGLAHNCWTGNEPHPADHAGALVPACSELEPGSDTTEATMFPRFEEGEIKKSSLESSDVLGLCAIASELECRLLPPGCSAGGAPTVPTASAWLFASLLLTQWSRRRRPTVRDR